MKRTLTPRCRIALLGFGTVGAAVARRLTAADADLAQPAFQLTHIFDRRAGEKRHALPAAGLTWTARIDDVLHADVDIVVEAIGGLEPAAGWIRDALLVGKSVVTANKQVIARHGASLLTLAARQGRQLRFEAAVGGAMPIVRAVGDGLAGDRITRIVAILNGTTNAVLSHMEAAGGSIESALADVRARGWAEAEPTADLDGDDARAKLAILCALAFGLRVDPSQIATRSTAPVTSGDFERARRQGGTIRQLAHAEYDRAASALTAWWLRWWCLAARSSPGPLARRTPRSSRAPTRATPASSGRAPAAMRRRSRSSATSPPSRATAPPSSRRARCRGRA